MFTLEYARLKQTVDARWSNVKKRGVQKALAEIGSLAAEVRAEGQRLADEWTARRLAAAKASASAADETLHRFAGPRTLARLLADGPAAADKCRAAYERMGVAASVERSLAARLTLSQQKLAKCRNRVDDKIAKMGRLRVLVAEARARAYRVSVAGDGDDGDEPPDPAWTAALSPAETAKKMDALRLANRQAARIRDLIAENVTMGHSINGQLAADVRQTAASVVELLAYGSVARREAAEFDREYCRAASRHKHAANRNSAIKQRLRNNITVLESNRSFKTYSPSPSPHPAPRFTGSGEVKALAESVAMCSQTECYDG